MRIILSSLVYSVLVSVDGGNPMPCTLTKEFDCLIVKKEGPQPAEDWRTFDQSGHFHAYNKDASDDESRYPTLMTVTHEPDPDEDGPYHEPESYLTCRLCPEQITPGTRQPRSVEKEEMVDKKVRWRVDLLTIEHIAKSQVSVRIISPDGEEWFGNADVAMERAQSESAQWHFDYRLHGITELGTSRKATQKPAKLPLKEHGPVEPEVGAMGVLVSALELLDPEARWRVMHWAAQRYKVRVD